MKILKKILLVLGLVLALALLGTWLFVNSLKPDYSGKETLANLNKEVNVFYDEYGIPHIYAENEEDAFRSLGYVHAQDRLWQMELIRRIAKGRLSEVFGKDLIETDKFFLSLGIDEHTKKTVSQLDTNLPMVKLSQAYLDGINAFVENGPKPVEFYLTGIESAPFEIEDIYNTVGYMAFSFAMGHRTDPLLTSIKNDLGEDYLADLAIMSDSSTTWIKTFKNMKKDSVVTTLGLSAIKALDKLPVPQFIGSNSWVLGPEKTKSGEVILANDPHISFAQPSVWYEAHVITPTYEKYGYHLAGVPFPLLAHDRNLAFGLTMFQNDDIDFYYETLNPENTSEYKTEEGWKSFETVQKQIVVKDSTPVDFQYKVSRHGPIMNGLAKGIDGETPIAASWLYTQHENRVMHGLFNMNWAKSIEDFKQALPDIHAPGLNIMYGDAEGNVGWWATAQLYSMPDSVSTKFILDGASGKNEKQSFLDFSQNPSAVNPPWNYVYSANNQPESSTSGGPLVTGYYLPENRAKRIVSLLEPKNDWDVDTTQEMILDVTSSVNPSLIRELIKNMDVSILEKDQLMVMDKLRQWDGTYSLDSQSALVYHRCAYHIIKNTFADELGPERFEQFLSTHLLKRQMAWGAKMQIGKWWDNVNTPDKKETRNDIVLKSFQDTWISLVNDFGKDPNDWTWEKVHTLEHEHPFGKVASLRKYFNVGPFPVNGSREVINNLMFVYDDSGYYPVTGGPSTRRIIDFSDIENSVSILPTGQSGNPLSDHYDDQAEMYVSGEFRKMMMNKSEIEAKAKSKLTFQPER